MSKKKIWFIVNPVSGIGRQKTVEKLVPELLNKDLYDFEIKHTQERGHARKIGLEAIEAGIDILVVVGGDGTVSEVASRLVNSNVELGIIPAGSGNGMARALQIPVNTRLAIKTLNKYNIVKIDAGEINGKIFANSSGVGFDAHISNHFLKLKNRGLSSYIRLAAREYFKFISKKYILEVEDKRIETYAWVISFANSSQYGNNALIAPNAVVNDKLLDVVIVTRVPLWAIPRMILRLFAGTLDKSPFVETFKAKELKLIMEEPAMVHLDGDPHEMDKELEIKIIPQSIKVIVPQKQKK